MISSKLKWAFFSYGHNLGDFTRALETAKGMKESGMDVKFFNHGGIHNYMIFQIVDKDGNKYEFNGNENPRDILPKYIIEKLNNKFCD